MVPLQLIEDLRVYFSANTDRGEYEKGEIEIDMKTDCSNITPVRPIYYARRRGFNLSVVFVIPHQNPYPESIVFDQKKCSLYFWMNKIILSMTKKTGKQYCPLKVFLYDF